MKDKNRDLLSPFFLKGLPIEEATNPSLKNYRDLKNIMDTAIEEAIDEKTHAIAKSLKNEGVPPPIIAKTTGLSLDEIEQL